MTSPMRAAAPVSAIGFGVRWLLRLAFVACFGLIVLVILSDPRVMSQVQKLTAGSAPASAPPGMTDSEIRAGTAYLAMLGRFSGYVAGAPDIPVPMLPAAALMAPTGAPEMETGQFTAQGIGQGAGARPVVNVMPTNRVKVRRAGQ